MTYMYSGTILLINLSEGKVSKEPTTSYSGDFLGGRGINIKLLYDGVPPEIGPLDPASLLIFGAGPLCGTPVPAPRTEITAKSPETDFLGSSNFGGYFAPELKFAGYDNIVITGRADKPVYLWIYNEQVEIRDASRIWGKDTYETQAIIHSEVDPEARIACIGQAGEHLVHFATVQSELGHGAGRTGMGGVMGSKNLKAIVVRGTKGITLANPEKYLSLAQKVQQVMRDHPGVQDRQNYGTAARGDRVQSYGTTATGGMIVQHAIQAPRMPASADLFWKYKDKIKRAGCFGCPTQCMHLYPVEAQGGGTISCALYKAPFYQVRNTDIDLLLETSLLAQRCGIDIATSIRIIRWLMELYEKGVITAKDTDGIPMEWGSREAIIGMLKKMIYREGFGDALADGMLPAAKRIGWGAKDYAYTMKGLPLYVANTPDALVPRKGEALAMAVNSRGDTMRARVPVLEDGIEVGEVHELALLWDKLYGEGAGAEYIEVVRQKVKQITGTEKAIPREAYEGKPELVVYAEDTGNINDCLGVCKMCCSFTDYPFSEEYQAALLSAGTGVETIEEMLFKFAKRVRNLERAYCVREGMTRDTDSLPKRFMDKPLEQGDFKGSVLESSKFEQMKSRYYALRGWDTATGIPTRETLEQTGLRDVAKDLEKRGKLPKKSAEGQSKT